MAGLDRVRLDNFTRKIKESRSKGQRLVSQMAILVQRKPVQLNSLDQSHSSVVYRWKVNFDCDADKFSPQAAWSMAEANGGRICVRCRRNPILSDSWSVCHWNTPLQDLELII